MNDRRDGQGNAEENTGTRAAEGAPVAVLIVRVASSAVLALLLSLLLLWFDLWATGAALVLVAVVFVVFVASDYRSFRRDARRRAGRTEPY